MPAAFSTAVPSTEAVAADASRCIIPDLCATEGVSGREGLASRGRGIGIRGTTFVQRCMYGQGQGQVHVESECRSK